MRRVVNLSSSKRYFSTTKVTRYHANDFRRFEKGDKPSRIDYNRLNFVRRREPVEYKRNTFKTYEVRGIERKRVVEMNKIKGEAYLSNSRLALKIGVVVTRQPVTLPSLDQAEIDFYRVKQESDLYEYKTYPKDILRMNVKRDAFAETTTSEDELPYAVEPWVYKALSRDTEVLEPYISIDNLKEKLLALDSGQNTQVSSVEEDEGGVSEETVQMLDEMADDDGWFDDDSQSSNVSAILDGYNLEIDYSSGEILEAQDIKPSSRVTEDDLANNLKSLYRKYEKPLYLIVKTDLGWRFPQLDYDSLASSVKDGLKDNLREIAEVGMSELTEGRCELFFVGNAPAGFVNEKNENYRQGDEIFGSSIFFYRANIMDDIFSSPSFDFESLIGKEGIIDIAWISEDDIEDILKGGSKVEEEYWSFCRLLLEN